MKKKAYKRELDSLQDELVQLQQWVIREDKKVVVLFEGRDAAGKGSAIKRIIERLNPNHYRVVAKGKPTPKEEKQKYFTRWRRELPKAGELVIFDRSWYTRAVVESVMGFATEVEVDKFFTDVKKFEKKLTDSGVIVIKFWLSITQDVQEQRFHSRLNDSHKRWKLSPMDLASRVMFDKYTVAKDRMFKKTNFKFNPWVIVNANDKRECRLHVIEHLTMVIPYVFKWIPPSSLAPVSISEPTIQPKDIKLIGFNNDAHISNTSKESG